MGCLRFWELLGVFWEFLREARRFSARFWLRLSAQQCPHLNRTRKSQLAISNTSVPSAIPQLSSASLSCHQQYPATLSIPQKTSQNFPKYPKISQNLPLSFSNFSIFNQHRQKTKKHRISRISFSRTALFFFHHDLRTPRPNKAFS